MLGERTGVRLPLTPREGNLRATPGKEAAAEGICSNSARSERTDKSLTTRPCAFEMEENDPSFAHEQATRGEVLKPNVQSMAKDTLQLQTSEGFAEVETSILHEGQADFGRLEAGLEARECKVIDELETSGNKNTEYAEAAQRATATSELLHQKRLQDMETAMQAEIAALKAEYTEAIRRLQTDHDAELDEVQLQSAEDIIQDIMTKVSRLQAAIAETGAQVGITVSWCPPSFSSSELQEEFEEMGAWLSRISDTLHELSRERRRLKDAHREEAQRRREVQAELFDLQGPVQVLCRLHDAPSDDSDESASLQEGPDDLATPDTVGRPVHDPDTPHRIKVNSNRYNFQTVFQVSDGLEALFDELEPTVLSVLDGHNVCILSHELSDSSSHATLRGSQVDTGMAARCVEALFEAAAADPSLTSARLHVSFVEASQTALYDIMASNPQGRGGQQDQRQPWIAIDPKSDSVEVHQQEVEDPEDAADVLQACFCHRQKNCAGNGSTGGHTLTCITVTTSNEGLETVSRLWIAGLSGSAVLAAEDQLDDNLRCTQSAHLSLSALATCLAVRCQGRSNIPWSESPLTCLLKGCLGPGSRIVLLVNLSESGPVSNSTAASLDWMSHLQSLSTTRHLNAHTLTQDDSSTIAASSLAQLHSVTSPPQLASAGLEPPATVDAVHSPGQPAEAGVPTFAAAPAAAAVRNEPQQEPLAAEVVQLRDCVQELLGENTRLRAQVSELTSKQTLTQADATFMSDYKVNSALARHELSARCSELETQLSQVRSALAQRGSSASASSVSKQSSIAEGEPRFSCAQPNCLSTSCSLPRADSAASVEVGAASAPLHSRPDAETTAATAAHAVEGTRGGGTAAELSTVGDSLNSVPTSEDLDTSSSREYAMCATALDTTNGAIDVEVNGELVATQPSQPFLNKLPEGFNDVSEDSLIKSSSFSVHPSSVGTRCDSDAVVTHHPFNPDGTFLGTAAVSLPEKSSTTDGVRHPGATHAVATDSSLMDSELLAVLSDCPSIAASKSAAKQCGASQELAAPCPHKLGLSGHSCDAPENHPPAAPDGQRLPEVFGSLDLAHFLEAGRDPSVTAGNSKKVGVIVPPLLTIPALPPQLPAHSSTGGPRNGPAVPQKPAIPRVLDSVDLSSFIRCDEDGSGTPRSFNVMNSVDLTAFMKADSECSALSAGAAKQGFQNVMNSIDLGAFIKGEASAEHAARACTDNMVHSQQCRSSAAVNVMDSVDLSNFIKSEDSGVAAHGLQAASATDVNMASMGPSDADTGSLAEDSHGRLECIAEESEAPDVFMSMTPDTKRSTRDSPCKHGDAGGSTAPANAKGTSSSAGANGSICAKRAAVCGSVPELADVASEVQGTPGAAEAPATNTSRVPESGALQECAAASTPQHKRILTQLMQDNDAEHSSFDAISDQPDEQTITLAPSISVLHSKQQVTPKLFAFNGSSDRAQVDSVATELLLRDSNDRQGGLHGSRTYASQHLDAVATDGQGWGGTERLDRDFDDDAEDGLTAPLHSGDGLGSGSGSGSRSRSRRSSLRLSLGRASVGLRGLFGSSRKGERSEGKRTERRWSMSVTPRRVITPRPEKAPVQTPAAEDGSQGGFKTPRSVLGSRASIDKLMRSAFKRSTTLLASARRTHRRQQCAEQTACVPEEHVSQAPLHDSVLRASADGHPATPKKLDFCAPGSGAPSPNVTNSTRSLQSCHSHSEVSPVLGFISPATVAETAQHARLMAPPHNTTTSTAAALARGKLPQGGSKLKPDGFRHPNEAVCAKGNFADAAAASSSAAKLGKKDVDLTSPQRAPVTALQHTSRLPRSPIANKTSCRGTVSQSTAPSSTPSTVPNNAGAVGATLSALPRSPFNRLKAALESQRRQFEQDERLPASPKAMPEGMHAAQRQVDVPQNDSSTHLSGIVYTACISNPHFSGGMDGPDGGLEAGSLQAEEAAADPEDRDNVLMGSVSLPGGLRLIGGGNSLMLSQDIAPPNASYAWLVNGPSAPCSQSSQHANMAADWAPAQPHSERAHQSRAATGTGGHGRPRTSPLPQLVPSALANLQSSSTSDLHHGLQASSSMCGGASAPLVSQVASCPSLDNNGNPTEIVRQGRGGGVAEAGITPRARSRGSYWRRGAPLMSSHKGTGLQPGAGSSRGSSPSAFRSVSPPLPAQPQSNITSRQFPAIKGDQSLLAAAGAAGVAQQSHLRHQKLRSAPASGLHHGRYNAAEDSLRPRQADDDQARSEAGKEAPVLRMKEVQDRSSSSHAPAPTLRDSSTLLTPASSQVRKPPGRVSHAKAAQQMARANADHNRRLAAAELKRKGRAWV